MGAAFSGLFRFLAWNAATLVFILAILVGGVWLRGELKRADELRLDRAALVSQQQAYSRDVAEKKVDAEKYAKRVLSDIRSNELALAQKRAELAALKARHLLMRNIPLSKVWQRIQFLEVEI